VTFPFPMVANFRAAVVEYTDQQSNEANATHYDFNTVAVGSAEANRFVVVAVMAVANSNFGNITGVVIGGVTGTLLSDGVTTAQIEDASGNSDFAIYGALVPSGTTVDIDVDLSGSPDRCGIMVWKVTKLNSTTPTNVNKINTASAALTQSVNVRNGGILIAAAGIESSATTFTWTNISERIDTAIGTGGSAMSGASDNTTVTSSVSITATPASVGARQGLLLVAMR
jgi:hypothetical protein